MSYPYSHSTNANIELFDLESLQLQYVATMAELLHIFQHLCSTIILSESMTSRFDGCLGMTSLYMDFHSPSDTAEISRRFGNSFQKKIECLYIAWHRNFLR